MADVATIDHTTVYVDVPRHRDGPVTSQPKPYRKDPVQPRGDVQYDPETAKVMSV